MSQLEEFMKLLTGNFDNREQYEALKKNGENYPFAEHVNTPCNDKITNLPSDFQGEFLVEESYYTTSKGKHVSSHLFLFTEEENGILLTSYDIPDGYDKNSFTYNDLKAVDFQTLKPSSKFTPALYQLKDGIFEGGSISMFSPVLKFTLFERFSTEWLEVSESMEVNGKRTFGYDEPILYKRKK
nr:hypothetical protein [uncultured Sellimonas sp.]